MAIQDCINAGVLDGSISRGTAEEANRKFNEFMDDGEVRTGLSQREREVRAAQRLEADMERARVRRKRMRILQAAKQTELSQRLATAEAGRVDKAALSVLEFDPSGRFHGDSVVASYQALRGNAWAIAETFVEQFRSKFAGITRDTTELPAVIKGLFGEDTTPQAKALADALTEARQYLVRRHNAAGGDIRLRKDWGWTQRHDGDVIRQAGKEEWKTFIMERLDPAKMVDAAGAPFTSRRLNAMVDAAFDDITGITPLSDAAAEFGSPISKRVAHREFVFKDATAWTEYHERFGGGDVLSAIIADMDRLARDTALIETMGPYPQATMKAMKDAIDQDRAKTGKGEIGNHRFLEETFDQVSGRAGLAANGTAAGFMQGVRNLITSARLGSAIFVSASDFGTAKLTADFNGLPQTALMREYFAQLNSANPAHRRLAARLGFVTETYLGDLVAAQRMLGEVSGSAITAKIADTSLRLSGLSAHTEGLRNAFKTSYVGHLTEQARFAFHSIDDTTRQALERYGITAEDWDLYRSTPIWTDEATKADFIRIEDVHRQFEDVRISPDEREARQAVARKLHNMISTEARFAVVEPTARSRAFVTQGSKPGSLPGEVVRSIAQFKAFTVAFSYLHGARGLALEGGFNKAAYAAGVFVPLTLAGAFAEQMSSISRGQDPRDMTDPKFWASAAARGGSLGPVGDFLFSGVLGENRHGLSIVSSFAGPFAGQVETGGKAFAKAVSGENATPELRRFAEGFLPGNSLWYSRLAFERLIKDQLQELADPKARQRFQRAERKARREFGQAFFWRRGEIAPRRSPDVAGAFGG